jgi:hypothetical protein
VLQILLLLRQALLLLLLLALERLRTLLLLGLQPKEKPVVSGCAAGTIAACH